MTSQIGVDYRLAKIKELQTKIFDLVYYGRFGYAEVNKMTYADLNWYHTHLIETKEAEREAQEKAFKAAEQKAQYNKYNNKRKRRKHRR